MSGDGSSTGMRPILVWTGLGVLLVVAFLAALGAVQRTFYSPSGFVTAYVQALASRDLTAALTMPGAAPTPAALRAAHLPADASRELLRSDVLPRLTGITVESDRELAGGEHLVTVHATADGAAVSAAFTVRPAGSVLGVLTTWEFATLPLTVAHVTVAHADTFSIGSYTLSPRATAPGQPAGAFSVAADYLLFAPGRYELGHTSTYLHADPAIVSGAPGRATEAVVDAEPTPAFVSAVQSQLNGFLDGCAKQAVLQPAGCPFGVQIDDRVQGAPAWSMVTYPAVALTAGPSTWTMAQTLGVAHLSVTVQSLFDGTVKQRESDEKFAVSLTNVTIRPDGSLSIVVGE